MPPRKRQPKELTIATEKVIYKIAWYEWKHMPAEAKALRDLCNWFEPPFRPDDDAIRAEVERLERDSRRLADPLNWD